MTHNPHRPHEDTWRSLRLPPAGPFGFSVDGLLTRIMILVVLGCLLSAVGCATSRSSLFAEDFRLQPGDLLFQDLDGSPLCDAIEKVTRGVDGAHFSHVGMVSDATQGQERIIEAVSAGVVETPLETFLARSQDAEGRPKVLVGRVRARYRHLVPVALAAAGQYRGRPYDSVFVMRTDAFYCSELIYEAFLEADGGQALFRLYPMTFNDPDTDKPFPAWVTYYQDLHTPIPEGEPGLNPGGISRSPVVEIVHAYGVPEGWK